MSKTWTKRLGIPRKRGDMSHEQFVQHWMTTHATLCKKLPGLRRYSVNLVDRGRFPAFGYDGFSELWFDSEDDLKAAFASDEGRTLGRSPQPAGAARRSAPGSRPDRTSPAMRAQHGRNVA